VAVALQAIAALLQATGNAGLLAIVRALVLARVAPVVLCALREASPCGKEVIPARGHGLEIVPHGALGAARGARQVTPLSKPTQFAPVTFTISGALALDPVFTILGALLRAKETVVARLARLALTPLVQHFVLLGDVLHPGVAFASAGHDAIAGEVATVDAR